MSGGSKKPATTATPATPAATPVQMQNYPAFMPGQQGLLAEQMSAGYGAPVSENMGLLANLYKPVNMPIITRPDQIETYLKSLNLAPVTGGTAANATGAWASPTATSGSNATASGERPYNEKRGFSLNPLPTGTITARTYDGTRGFSLNPLPTDPIKPRAYAGSRASK